MYCLKCFLIYISTIKLAISLHTSTNKLIDMYLVLKARSTIPNLMNLMQALFVDL